jgi:hypothetical protein
MHDAVVWLESDGFSVVTGWLFCARLKKHALD